MKRNVLLAALAILCLATSAPVFACSYCQWDARCSLETDQVNTWCEQYIDFCWDYGGCTPGGAASRPLADQLTVASVEVVTPAGTSRIEPTRTAERRPSADRVAFINR
jgi:hypothetical protein